MINRLKKTAFPKLTIAFSLIIALFTSIVVYTGFAFNEMSALHNYKINYINARAEYLFEFRQELNNLRFLITGSGQEEDYSVYARINQLAEDFISSVNNDPLYIDIDTDLHIDLMTGAVSLVRQIYPDFNASLNLETLSHRIDIVDEVYIQDLRLLSTEARESVIELMNHSLMQVGQIEMGLMALLFLLLVVLFWLMLKAFTKAVKLYRKKVLLQKNGEPVSLKDIYDDEMSDIVSNVADTFVDLVTEINIITKENQKGNIEARIDTERFGGMYKEAADAINSLLNIIVREKEINEARQLMFDAAPVVMTLFDKDLNVLDCNEEALRRYGLKSKTEYAADFFAVSPEFQPDGLLSAQKGKDIMLKCFETGFVRFEWMHQTAAGQPLPSEIMCRRIKYNNQDVMLAYAIDLRELKKTMERAYEAEERSNEERARVIAAEENLQMKSRFLAKMSHEIRTPIAAVLGISEIQLHTGKLPADLEEAFVKIYNSASILLNIVNDILDLSKIETGKMPVIEEKYDTSGMLSDIVQLNLALLGSKRIDFIVDISENLPLNMIGDEIRIRQILNNLLSNSFKYTQKGFVELKVEPRESAKEDFMEMVITISDSGHGMTSKQLEALFDEYVRFHQKETKFLEGTGLGMPITYNLLQLMGGTIDVQSTVGEGTKITVVIPQKIAGDETLGKEAAKDLREFKMDSRSASKKLNFVPEPMSYGKVLVVDDVDTNIYVAKGLLSMYQLQIESCESGLIAIEKIKEGNEYDIVFMDHMMPDLDGIETTQILREMNYTHPIVALTANALIGQAEEFLKNGFDGFVSKPIQITHLDAVLKKFIRNKFNPDTDFSDLDIDFSDFDEEDEEDFTTNPETAARIRQDFLESQQNALAEINLAINEDDMKKAHRLAHNLKNMAGLLNDKELKKIAEIVEKELKAGEVNQEHMDILEIELVRTLNRLSNEE